MRAGQPVGTPRNIPTGLEQSAAKDLRTVSAQVRGVTLMPTLWSRRGVPSRVNSSRAMHLAPLQLQTNMDQAGSVRTVCGKPATPPAIGAEQRSEYGRTKRRNDRLAWTAGRRCHRNGEVTARCNTQGMCTNAVSRKTQPNIPPCKGSVRAGKTDVPAVGSPGAARPLRMMTRRQSRRASPPWATIPSCCCNQHPARGWFAVASGPFASCHARGGVGSRL
jgi:hypothetical protein